MFRYFLLLGFILFVNYSLFSQSSCVVGIGPPVISFQHSGGTANFEVGTVTNCSWNFQDIWSWLDFSTTGGIGTKTISITCSQNFGPERSTTLTIDGKSINIIQSAGPPSPAGTITVSGSTCSGSTLNCTISSIFGATSYYWSVVGGTIISGQGSLTATVELGNGSSAQISVYGVNSIGNGIPSSKTVSITQTPNIPITIDGSTTCGPGVVTLQAYSEETDVTFNWYADQTGGSIIPASGTSYTPNNYPISWLDTYITEQTSYYVSAIRTGCSSQRAIAIGRTSFLNTININTSGPPFICSGEPITLSAVGVTTGTCQWRYNDASGQIISTDQQITVTEAGYYYLSGQTNCGIQSTQIYIEVLPLPNITISANPSFEINNGESAILSASGGESYIWSPDGQTNDQITVSPTSSAIYSVKGTGTNGCSKTISEIVHIKMVLNLEFSKPNLTVSANYGKSPYSYLWNTGSTSNSIEVIQNGEYTVSVKDTYGQVSTASYTVDEIREFTQNYIKTTEPLIGSTSLPAVENCNIAYQYFDGLGRSSQNISVGASPSQKDIIQIIDYDEFGREKEKFMPFTAESSGGFMAQTEAKELNKDFYHGFFQDEEDKFTAITDFEPSPLNRPLRQGSPGLDWQLEQGHVQTFSYETNSVPVKKWKIIAGQISNAIDQSYFEADTDYPPASLVVSVVTDEQNKTAREYKNTEGLVVLKEMPGGFKTYYVYDDFGLLRCVIPPMASDVDDEYCYYYKYDDRHRLIEKSCREPVL